MKQNIWIITSRLLILVYLNLSEIRGGEMRSGDSRRTDIPQSQSDSQRKDLGNPRQLTDTNYMRNQIGDSGGSAFLLSAFQRDNVANSPQVCRSSAVSQTSRFFFIVSHHLCCQTSYINCILNSSFFNGHCRMDHYILY